MKELLKKLWEGVNGLSAVDFSETGISFVKDDPELHKRTLKNDEKDVEEKESEAPTKSGRRWPIKCPK